MIYSILTYFNIYYCVHVNNNIKKTDYFASCKHSHPIAYLLYLGIKYNNGAIH